MDPMQAIRETFFQECEEQLGELETGLIAMEDGAADNETVNAVFRAVHSIKGGAGAFKLDRLVQVSRTCSRRRSTRSATALLRPSPAVMKTMLRAADVLADLVDEARARAATSTMRRSKELIAELKRSLRGRRRRRACGGQRRTKTSADPFEALGCEPVTLSLTVEPRRPRLEYRIAFRPKPELYARATRRRRLMRELARLGLAQGAMRDRRRSARSPIWMPEQSYLSWRVELRTRAGHRSRCGGVRIRRRRLPSRHRAVEPRPAQAVSTRCPSRSRVGSGTSEPEPRAEATKETPAARQRPRSQRQAAAKRRVTHAARGRARPKPPPARIPQQGTIRVDLDRVDRLINLVGELVINQAMLTQRVLEAGAVKNASVATGLEDLEHLTRDIQESVMAIRAQPVRPLFQRMSRIVREVADATGKNVRLKTEGESAEVDRTVIERLADPLTHMIRNAVDHGLERPERAPRRRQARAGRSAAVGRAQVRPRRHRGRRRRRAASTGRR